MTDSPHTADIVERLLAVENASPDFLSADEGWCVTCYHRNPDGPEAAAIIKVMREALRVAAQAFRTLEEVAVAQLEHDKARNFIQLGDMCRQALATQEAPHAPQE